ncbi:hypothetical protein, partial [Escherichia coli]|uniref:hypothetical protein n=1 Tax=Escherichia coli TaxID=562 RepID=UPI001957E1EA
MPKLKSQIIQACLLTVALTGGAAADENLWRVGKVTGQAWSSGSGATTVSVTTAAGLKAGETLQTGRNGRVLLLRGAETILVGPNSSVTLPGTSRGGKTTI